MAGSFTGKVVTYGVASDATFKAHRLRDLGLGGSGFTVRHAGSDTDFVLPLLGQHNVANAVAAIAVGIEHGISWPEVRSAIAGIKPEKKRGEVVRFQEGFDVIDDSYNSNPRALAEMIRFLGKLEGYKRKIVVAGEMLELGPTSAELHRSCGVEAARAGATLIVGVQGEARSVLEGAREAGVEDQRLKFAANAAEAGALLSGFVQSGDVVLIKGSRGVKLEQVLSALRQSFSSVEA
jgi:UDP-N-acetylmuramoyl-tripeptide--D-alanyl-D-alanine ligase